MPNEPVSQLDKISSVRAKYPTPLASKHGEFLNEAAWVTGGKLLVKPGTGIVVGGKEVSQDGLIVEGWFVDILFNGEGEAIPIWLPKGPVLPEWTYVAPTKPQDAPGPPSGPDPDPKPNPALEKLLASILDRLDALEDEARAALQAEQVQAVRIDQLAEELRKPREFEAKCGRTAYHTHTITVTEKK